MFYPMHEAVVENENLAVSVFGRLAGHPNTCPRTAFQAEMGHQAAVDRTGMGMKGALWLDGREANVKAVVRNLPQQLSCPRASREMLPNWPA